MGKEKSDLLQGTLDMLVLKALQHRADARLRHLRPHPRARTSARRADAQRIASAVRHLRTEAMRGVTEIWAHERGALNRSRILLAPQENWRALKLSP